jgi:hypothetical protein
MLQAERAGLSTARAKALMTDIWLTTKNGKEFQAALADKGWMLARGDRRDFRGDRYQRRRAQHDATRD